jgi:uncharacterized protein YbaP (TraB family)
MDARSLPVIRIVLGALAALAVAAVLMVRLGASGTAEPAMWVVKDTDSTIYLLGTFHMVKPDTKWRSDKIAAAFDSSDELWLEADVSGDPAKTQALVLKYGLDPSHPLSSKLSPEMKDKLDQVATAAGLKPAKLEPLRPWVAALAVVVAPLMRAGYDPAKGVDRELGAEAKTAHKKIKTFETAEQQILIFANLSEAAQLDFLSQSLDEAAIGPETVDQMANAWIAGDVDTLGDLMLGKMKDRAPELYETLIVQRNRAWSERIATMMAGAGTSFIAVGAGHLTGENSVQSLLAKRGLEVARY